MKLFEKPDKLIEKHGGTALMIKTSKNSKILSVIMSEKTLQTLREALIAASNKRGIESD